MELPGIDKVRKLDLRPGDRIVVHLDREATDQEGHEIVTRLRRVVGADVRVIVLEPGIELEAQPDPGGM